MPRELIYPCFLSCLEFTEDEYWKNIFEDLSFGVTPQGTYITKNYIISNVKNREFTYKIKTDIESETIFIDIYTLFSEKLGLKSVNELEDYKNSIDSSEVIFSSWNSIKKKSIRDSIIMNYVSDRTIEYNLSPITAYRLLNMINLRLMLKFITTKDIHYDNGVIHMIDGIDYSENSFVFSKITDFASNPVEYHKNKVNLNDIWQKMIETLEKNVYIISQPKCNKQ